MQEDLAAPTTLKQQTGMPLAGRCEAINERYGFPRMNQTLLRQIYRKVGIKKKAYKYKKVVTPDLAAQLPALTEQVKI